jgi:hypothetical protein
VVLITKYNFIDMDDFWPKTEVERYAYRNGLWYGFMILGVFAIVMLFTDITTVKLVLILAPSWCALLLIIKNGLDIRNYLKFRKWYLNEWMQSPGEHPPVRSYAQWRKDRKSDLEWAKTYEEGDVFDKGNQRRVDLMLEAEKTLIEKLGEHYDTASLEGVEFSNVEWRVLSSVREIGLGSVIDYGQFCPKFPTSKFYDHVGRPKFRRYYNRDHPKHLQPEEE